MTALTYIIITVLLALSLYFIYFLLFGKKTAKQKNPMGKRVCFVVSVPKENEKSPAAAESMFAALHGIYKTEAELKGSEDQPRISFEIVADHQAIKFYVCVPQEIKDFVEGQIYAQYPKVEIEVVEDYSKELSQKLDDLPEFPKNFSLAATDLKLNRADFYPIKTYENFDVDPLSAITAVLSKLAHKEHTWIQILIEPISNDWQETAVKYAEKVRSGENPAETSSDRFFKGAGKLFSELWRTAANPSAEKGSPPEVKLPGPVEEALTGIDTKVTKLGFATKIRVVAMAENRGLAHSRLISVVGAFKQFNITNINGFALGEIIFDDKEWLLEYQKRTFDDGFILNISELASLYHLPNLSVETPNIVWAGAKKGEPPANLPLPSNTLATDLAIFAKTDFRGEIQKFGIKTEDRRRHVYVIGKTGTGKTTMLHNMAISDIRAGKGLAVVDPHGDFVDDLLRFIPKSRINDVVIFDPSDVDNPVAFNLLENVDPSLKNIVASGLIGIFKKIWLDSWGPRLEHILRNTIIALLDYPSSTMMGILKMLVDRDYRKKVVEKVQDPIVKDFWISEFEQYDQRFRTEAVAPIQNKVGQFLSSSVIRNILGQPKSTINVKDIMDNGKILLVNLSKGKIGEDNSALLGAMIITKIQITALQRAYIPEAERQDFYLYVDEFQNFATESFAVILSEARKYKLSIIMANQYITQMEELVRESVFGNVGTLISFRVGPSDAPYLAKEYMPSFEETDLINLDKYHVYVKMSVDGVTTPPFSAITLPPYEDANENREKVIATSRERFSKNRNFVEEKIKEASLGKENPSGGITFEEKPKVEAPKIKGLQQITDSGGEYWYVIPKGGEVPEEVKKLEASSKKPAASTPKNTGLDNKKQDTRTPHFAEASRGRQETNPKMEQKDIVRHKKGENATNPPTEPKPIQTGQEPLKQANTPKNSPKPLEEGRAVDLNGKEDKG